MSLTCLNKNNVPVFVKYGISHDLIIQWRWQRFVSLKDKKHGYNRLSCALSDYDSDGDGTVRVSEFLSSVSAGSEGEGIAGLIDQNSKYRTNQSSNDQRHYSRLQISMSSYAVWTNIVILATLVCDSTSLVEMVLKINYRLRHHEPYGRVLSFFL